MSAAEPPRARDVLSLVDEYASRSPERKTAYSKAAAKSGVSVAALRTAACRQGEKEHRRSLKYAFSEREEDLLEAACVFHARQGIPLTYDEFC